MPERITRRPQKQQDGPQQQQLTPRIIDTSLSARVLVAKPPPKGTSKAAQDVESASHTQYRPPTPLTLKREKKPLNSLFSVVKKPHPTAPTKWKETHNTAKKQTRPRKHRQKTNKRLWNTTQSQTHRECSRSSRHKTGRSNSHELHTQTSNTRNGGTTSANGTSNAANTCQTTKTATISLYV